MMHYAVYDMDKTIIAQASWNPWLFFYARQTSPWRLLLLPLLLPALILYALGLKGRAGLKESSQRWLMGRRVPLARVAEVAEQFAEQFGSKAERVSALQQIAADREAGRVLVLATASAAFYAKALAARWGFDIVVATSNAEEEGSLTPRIIGGNCYGFNKLRLVLQAIGEQPQETIFYSDSESDLPSFLWAAKPVAVTPTAALGALARIHGWKVCWWH